MKNTFKFILLMLSALPGYANNPIVSTEDWKLKAVVAKDSDNDPVIIQSLQNGTDYKSKSSIAPATTRSFSVKLPVMSNSGLFTFSFEGSLAGIQVNTFSSADGTTWIPVITNAYTNGRGEDLQKVDIPVSVSSKWFRVSFVNSSASSRFIKELGMYELKAGVKNQYFLILGASITESAGIHTEWMETIKSRINPALQPLVFNWALSGENSDGIKKRTDEFLQQHPHASCVLVEAGGNDVSALRPLTFAKRNSTDMINLENQIRYIIQAVKNANKIPVLSRLSYRNYIAATSWRGWAQPAVNGGLNQENGSLPFNFTVDKIIKEMTPMFWDAEERRGAIDFYPFTLNNQSWLVNGDGVHFYGSATFNIRNFWTDYAFKFLYTGEKTAPIIYNEYVPELKTKATNAVVKAELSQLESDIWNARILVDQIASKTVRISLLDRIENIGKTPVAPFITKQPKDTTVVAGKGYSFSVTAGGTSLAYQWSKNGVPIPGATTNTYTNLSKLTDNNAEFICTILNSTDTITSVPVLLKVDPDVTPATITLQPKNAQVLEGSTASFSVSTNGPSITYQWQKDGVNLAGATSNPLSVNVAGLELNNAKYRCIVSNSFGKDSSNSALLTVLPLGTENGLTGRYYSTSYAGFNVPVALTRTDADINFSWGLNSPDPLVSKEQFSVRWTGKIRPQHTEEYTFFIRSDDGVKLWINNKLLIDKWLYQGETECSGKISLVAGQSYDVKIEYFDGNASALCKFYWSSLSLNKQIVPSSALFPENSIIVKTPPAITKQPVNLTVSEGAPAAFSVTVSGTSPFTYQWQKNEVNISGAIQSTYTIPATDLSDNNTNYRCQVTNSVGTVTSVAAVLKVNTLVTAPVITQQPSNVTVTAGSPATFTVTVSGTSPFTYQWQKNEVNIAGATLNSYTIPVSALTDNSTNYRCQVTNSVGNIISAAAVLKVNALTTAPVITQQPSSITVTAGAPVNFSVTVSGTSPFTYQWQKNEVDIAGATQSAYTIPATTLSDNNANYSCQITNSAGTVISNVAVLKVNAIATAPVITRQPSNVSVTAGAPVTFSVTASGTAPFTYQWLKNEVNITGATQSSFTITATSLADHNNKYRCIVTNTVGSVSSNLALLTVNSVNITNGLTARYYSNVYAGFSNTVAMSRTDAAINFNWGANAPDPKVSVDKFAVRWTGQIQPAHTETYTFFTQSDDGIRLWVNNQLLVDQWVYQGEKEYFGSITLTAGTRYNIKVEYFEGNGSAICRLLWKSHSVPKQIVPSANLFPDVNSREAAEEETEFITESVSKSIAVYPTIADNHITIQNVESGSVIYIISLNGQSIREEKISSDNLINVSDLQPGTYFVRAGNQTKMFFKR